MFRSKKILVDHTPPTFGNISTNVLAADSKPSVRLEVLWNVTDDESGVQMCYVSVGKLIMVKCQR